MDSNREKFIMIYFFKNIRKIFITFYLSEISENIMLIRRNDYMDRLYEGKDDNDVIKVITGMRRCGKSTLLEMYMDELIQLGVSENCIFHMNLESPEGQLITDSKDLNEWLMQIPRDIQTYLFLDEIQNVSNWEKSLAATGTMKLCDVYVTGSNSKLLSSELSTHISGRHVEIKMLPFSFKEYLIKHPSEDIEKCFEMFLRYGSLPAIDPSKGDRYCMDYLEGVFNTVLLKDVMERKELRGSRKLRNIARYLSSNIGNITNDSVISKQSCINPVTVDRYIEGLVESLLFHQVERYDIIGKRLLNSNVKYYVTDLGIRNAALAGAIGTDIGRQIENVVFLELLRRRYTVRVGSFRDSEIDFTATRDGITEYFQVTTTLMSQETKDREIKPFTAVHDNWRKTIITMDRLGLGSEDGVDIVNLYDWLLND